MNEVLIKYKALDASLQKQVLDFMDYLLSLKNKAKSTNMSDYKKKILKTSTWSENDIKVFHDNAKNFSSWNIEEF